MVILTRGVAKGRLRKGDFIGRNPQNLMARWFDVKSRGRRQS